MRQVLSETLALAHIPSVRTIGAIATLGGCALVSVPLFDIPGYELAEAMALASIVTGGIAGVAAARGEREGNTGRAIGAAALWTSLLLLPPFLAATGKTLLFTPCHPFATVAFYPLLTVPSALLAAAVGAFFGFACHRRWTAALLYLLTVGASALWTLWPLWAGPQVYAFNHFGGYLPGPLYDEVLRVRSGLLWFRVETLFWTALFVIASVIVADLRQGRTSRARFVFVLMLVPCAVGIGMFERHAASLGFRTSTEEVSRVLSGTRETEHFLIHHLPSASLEKVERLARDLEFRQMQIRRFYDDGPAQKMAVFVYASPEQKEALVGAFSTQFAKPWRLELHLNDSAFPNPTLKHELAHVMAAPFGSGPFRVTSRLGIWPVMGVIEGLAVAADDPSEALTLHEAASGMQRQHLAPDIRRLLSAEGFYSNAPSRAYTVVGSFLRFLAERYGPTKLMRLYAHGAFDEVYKKSLSQLASEWEDFLKTLPLDNEAVAQAFLRFRQPSLFSRACAREVARDQAEAQQRATLEPEVALGLYTRCQKLQPDEPSFVLAVADLNRHLHRPKQAAEVLQRYAETGDRSPTLLAQMALAQADLSYEEGRPEVAARFLQHALELGGTEALRRTAEVKLAGLADKNSGEAIWGYFGNEREEVKLLRLKIASEKAPENGILSYLLGRRLMQTTPELAYPFLLHAVKQDLLASVRKESQKLLPEAAYLAGRCDDVRRIVPKAPPSSAAAKAQALEWQARCDFEETTWGSALVPGSGFR